MLQRRKADTQSWVPLGRILFLLVIPEMSFLKYKKETGNKQQSFSSQYSIMGRVLWISIFFVQVLSLCFISGSGHVTLFLTGLSRSSNNENIPG